MTRQAMPSADAAWLHMDSPTNPMVVNGLVVLDRVPDPQLTTKLLEERLVGRFPRFRQRVVDPIGRKPAFEDDPAFEIGDHLHRMTLPAPGDRVALQELVGDLVSSPLDPGKPLWHAYLIEGYDGGAAILWRIHHCIADGIALARVMLATTDEDPGQAPQPAMPAESRGAMRRVTDLPRLAASAARDAGTAVLHEGMETVAHPDHLRELARSALRDTSTAAKLLAAPADAPSRLRAPLTGTRRVAWSESTPLAAIKEAARPRRLTVNDVLLTALSAALRGSLAGNGPAPEEIHAMVPFNLRPPDEPIPAELGNDFALILLPLPVGDVSRVERLRQVSSRMEAIKRSNEAPISFGLISAIGMTPPWAEDRLIGFFSGKASVVVTNVPGPAGHLHFVGARIDNVLVWAPCSGSLGITVSIFSYAGEVTAGFMADTALFDDPGVLARAYDEELAALVGF